MIRVVETKRFHEDDYDDTEKEVVSSFYAEWSRSHNYNSAMVALKKAYKRVWYNTEHFGIWVEGNIPSLELLQKGVVGYTTRSYTRYWVNAQGQLLGKVHESSRRVTEGYRDDTRRETQTMRGAILSHVAEARETDSNTKLDQYLAKHRGTEKGDVASLLKTKNPAHLKNVPADLLAQVKKEIQNFSEAVSPDSSNKITDSAYQIVIKVQDPTSYRGPTMTQGGRNKAIANEILTAVLAGVGQAFYALAERGDLDTHAYEQTVKAVKAEMLDRLR